MNAAASPMTPAKRAGNRRGFGSQLREEIVAAAERLLAEPGSGEAVTLRAIAREAGIAAPSIYAHFADRDAILDAVVGRAFDAVAETCRAAAESATSGVEEVEAIATAYVGFAREYPGRYRVLFERSPANVSSPSRPYEQGITAFGLVVSALQRMSAESTLTSNRQADADLELTAQTLFLALHGIATLPLALPGFPWRDEAELIRSVVSLGRAALWRAG